MSRLNIILSVNKRRSALECDNHIPNVNLGRYFVRYTVGNHILSCRSHTIVPGRVAQLVTCLQTDASLTADPGVASLILARSHTFVEIDHGIISTVILLPSNESFQGSGTEKAKVCARSTGLLLVQACPGKSVVR